MDPRAELRVSASGKEHTPRAGRAMIFGRIGTWIGRVLAAVGAVLLCLAAAGAIYQTVASAQDARRYPPPGRLVDVGGHRLHVNCAGSGSPTVILEAALGSGSPTWAWVQPEVARVTRVCAYDRAGEGWSELGPEPRDAQQIAGELHTLLERADLHGPYVLAGHSFGGLYVRMFATLYPDEVAGLVLIDASHPDQWARSDDGRAAQRANEVSAAIAPWLARIGLLRLTHFIAADPDLPAQQQAELEAFSNASRVWLSYSSAFRVTDQTMDQVRHARLRAGLPVVVLTATEHGMSPDAELLHQSLQAELATLSSASLHKVVDGATHISLVHNQVQSQTTIVAVQQVVEWVRRHSH